MVTSHAGAPLAWELFDRVVAEAESRNIENPWVRDDTGRLVHRPDFDVLGKLLGVPLLLGSVSQSGLLAIAVDVWISYELRRAGFEADSVWPRASQPRVLPQSLSTFVEGIQGPLKDQIVARYDQRGGSRSRSSAAPASAKILGKNYVKQVDVVISDWATGPEVLISTKRMDSSYGNNALNRVEESYGDAKNLRLRHPLAAIGFVFALSSGIYDRNANLVPKLKDLLAKLGQEDDAYHAVMLVMPDYTTVSPRPVSEFESLLEAARVDGVAVADRIPTVGILLDESPAEIAPSTFFEKIIGRALDNTPVDFHPHSRELRQAALSSTP